METNQAGADPRTSLGETLLIILSPALAVGVLLLTLILLFGGAKCWNTSR